ncbi:receptor-like protein kinase [Pyrus ussuriensis x Pyrus communis]|uniref:Receptor-like protein kinase n=1 Tax=Pyrus ussuriensis x Pyrus communis TaxID=2448454 RepID=A0A5N5HLL8_9ROSA|nr:receptor-like protein kinase [Pyrus ussuriensis x Pyrus communis]
MYNYYVYISAQLQKEKFMRIIFIIISSEMQKLFISSFCILLLVFFKLVGASQYMCPESKCGDDQGPAIQSPLRISLPHHCGNPGLECNGGYEQQILVKSFVKHIDYKRQEIQVYDPSNCLLLKPVEITNMPPSPFYLSNFRILNLTLFSCPTSVARDMALYQVPCLGDSGRRIYAIDSTYEIERFFQNLQFCSKMYDVLSVPFGDWVGNGRVLQFKWSKPNCTECEAEGKTCTWKNNGTNGEIECQHVSKPSNTWKKVLTGGILGSLLLVLPMIAAYRVYRADRKEKESQLRIERFLEDYKALKPSRYSYADIKRITNQFKDKLGQGAYGTVFKGMLSSEFFIAVKVLNTSKGDGEEFVNEVRTMGLIHHVNVARLVGFCADGFIRALVYEFFPNGSLQDFISSADSKNSSLGWDKLQDIALGIAKGIEYLHQGCDLRILHFDIKPHNVLLDQNFTPKISDFGLAKLCSKDQSLVSMTTARGTMGYIAPEVYSRNFGNVSYKVDVYSFGMLLLEMVGGRKNIGSTTENTTSEIYYPQWIYNLLEDGDDLRIRIGQEEDGKIPKKLAIIGLWCIQWHPSNRPSMKIAVQMLEGGEDSLTVPPNPFMPTGPTTRNARHLELEAVAELE